MSPAGVDESGPLRSTVLIGTSLRDGAVGRQFAELASQLKEVGFEAYLVVHGDHARPEWLEPGVKILSWPSARPTRLVDVGFFSRLVRQHKPAAVIANFGATGIMMNVGAVYRVPVRIFWHHTLSSQIDLDWPHSYWRLWLLRIRAAYTFRLATHVAANSQAALRDLVAKYRVAEDSISVFWNALPDPFSKAPFQGDSAYRAKDASLKIVCVGRFMSSKGQDLLIEALPTVVNAFPGVEVEFVGDGDTLARCRDETSRSGLNGHCVFRGKLSHAEVLASLATATLTVVPSRSEAFGLVNIESMAVGTPLVASRTGGIPEIVRDGEDGFLFPSGDSRALAGCILRLLGDRDLRLRMAGNCRNRFLELFELKRSVRKQVEWIRGLISAAVNPGR